MTIDFGRELVDAGCADSAAAVEELHRTDGPAVTTGCCRTIGGLVWIEHDRTVLPGAQEPALAALRTACADMAWVRLPQVTPTGTAVYSGVTGTQLLVDRMLPDQDLDAGLSEFLVAAHAQLGVALAQLHARSLEPAETRALLRPHRAVGDVLALVRRQVGGPPATLALERTQERLLCDHRDLADLLLESCVAFSLCPDSAILHGRFCPGYVVAPQEDTAGRVQVIGWMDGTFGPPALDVGWFIGELEELRAGYPTTAAAATIERCRDAFLGAYLGARPKVDEAVLLREATGFAALKIVAHLLEFVRGFGYHTDPVADHLALAERVLDGGGTR